MNEELQYTEGVRYAEDRIKSTKQKLDGINPCVIAKNDLKNGIHKESQYLNYFINVVLGLDLVDKDGNQILKRAKLVSEKGENFRLTVEEQVACIIEQATDLNILGRTWAGWAPFI
jgi:DNA-dependent protein kinase catalytic subunit